MELNENQIQGLVDTIKNIENEVGKAIIGQKDIVRQVLLSVLAGGNVLLEGVPGLGKTQLIKTLAKVMELSFSRIQFTPRPNASRRSRYQHHCKGSRWRK